MPILFNSLSTFNSSRVEIDLPEVELKQSQITFDGGVTFNFVDALSSCIDFKSKNYTNFYLTPQTLFSDITVSDNLKLIPKAFLTHIVFGTVNPPRVSSRAPTLPRRPLYLAPQPLSSGNKSSYGYYYTAELVETTQERSAKFKIEIHDSEYCAISHQSDVSKNYLVVDADKRCSFRQAILFDSAFSVNSDIYFRYILNGNRLILLKDIDGVAYQLAPFGRFLSAVNVSQNPLSSIIPKYALTISNNIIVDQEISGNTSYINYEPNTLDVNIDGSMFNLKNNYLLYRNLTPQNLNTFKVIVLKNQMAENGSLFKSNNLSLSSEKRLLDNRSYTSIGQDIQTLEDQNLSINYVYNNKSVKIAPGSNYILTEKSLFPFSQLNINDTTLIESGAFSSLSPKYADKVTSVVISQTQKEYKYLCTWLSGSPLSNSKVWIDRYYYPNIETKEAALAGNGIYNDTYDSFIENLVLTNSDIKSNTEDTLYFDKMSDLVFKPNSEYIYDRIDLDNLDFVRDKSLPTKDKGFYQTINDNNGFCFSCNILNYDDREFQKIYSRFNRKEAGLDITYNNETIEVSYTVYNVASQQVETVGTGFVPVLRGTSNNVVFSANHKTGRVVCYINGIILFETYIAPLYYLPLFGDITANDLDIFQSEDLISELIITGQPLNDEEVSLLVARYNDSKAGFNISLPCGQRNKSDTISYINSLTTNLKSKANAINIYINNLDIDDENVQANIKANIESTVRDVLPTNIEINSLEIIS
jgi:hypothetical protein